MCKSPRCRTRTRRWPRLPLETDLLSRPHPEFLPTVYGLKVRVLTLRQLQCSEHGPLPLSETRMKPQCSRPHRAPSSPAPQPLMRACTSQLTSRLVSMEGLQVVL